MMFGSLFMAGVPRAAALLGAAGALPFLGTAVAVWLLDSPNTFYALEVQRTYAACILSFLGAVHWGLAMAAAPGSPGAARLVASVMPCLIAWFALLLVPWLGLSLLILAFAGLYFYDLRGAAAGLTPDWYPNLRRPLTVAVVLSLGTSLLRIL